MDNDLHHWILKDGEPVKTDLLTWARWFEDNERSIACDKLPGEVRVSTVFMGLDHQWGDGPPLLFETMIFGGPQDGYQDRYSTRQEALAGHLRAVLLARNSERMALGLKLVSLAGAAIATVIGFGVLWWVVHG